MIILCEVSGLVRQFKLVVLTYFPWSRSVGRLAHVSAAVGIRALFIVMLWLPGNDALVR